MTKPSAGPPDDSQPPEAGPESTGETTAREQLRTGFDAVAELYDRVRPHYPAALLDELAELLPPGGRVLEIGPGTGRLTVELARRGFTVTAVELGPALADIARRALAQAPRVQVETAAFEEWPLPVEPFDAVVYATSFHWISPAVRVAKAAAALHPGGTLALVTTEHVAGGSTEFFDETQSYYRRWDPATPPGLLLLPASAVATATGELTATGDFLSLRVRRHCQDIDYTAQEYLDVLGTYSGHLALAPGARAGLLADIRQLIDGRYQGRITKRYLHELITAGRR